VFPARYELNSYTVFRKRLVSKRLKDVVRMSEIKEIRVEKIFIGILGTRGS
jgi:hypothetical protein